MRRTVCKSIRRLAIRHIVWGRNETAEINGHKRSGPTKILKSEPVFELDKHKRNECYRCGADNFNLKHLKKCPTKNHHCEFCSIMGHWEKCCNQKYPQRKRNMRQKKTKGTKKNQLRIRRRR